MTHTSIDGHQAIYHRITSKCAIFRAVHIVMNTYETMVKMEAYVVASGNIKRSTQRTRPKIQGYCCHKLNSSIGMAANKSLTLSLYIFSESNLGVIWLVRVIHCSLTLNYYI